MKTLDWKNILRRHKLFSALDEDELAGLLAEQVSQERECPKDHVILRQGEAPDSLFVVGSGVVEVIMIGADGTRVPLAKLGKDEFFGEMGLLEERPRSATVIAKEPCVLLEIDGEEVLKATHRHPEMEFRMLLKLSQRLRHVSQQVLAFEMKDVDDKLKLLNTRLDADLKVMDSSLKAARTVFDQTTTRANEIIESADRGRTQLKYVVSIVAMIGAFLGYFGVDKYLKLDTDVTKLEGLNERVGEATNLADKFIAISSSVKTFDEKLGQLEEKAERIDKVTSDFYKKVMIPQFIERLEEDPEAAQGIYKMALESENQDFIDEFFKAINREIMTIQDQDKDKDKRDYYRIILDIGIKDEYAEKREDIILSYYLLMAAQIIDSNDEKVEEEYQETYARFTDYVQGEAGTSVKNSLEEDFDPSTFKNFIESLGFDAEISTLMKSKIDKVWNQIP